MAFRVKSIYEYASPHEDDLGFPVGQIITITDQEDEDWYGGEYVDDAGVKHEGIFPRNFVEKFEPAAPPRPQRTRTKKESEPSAEPAATSPRSPQQPLAGPSLSALAGEEVSEEPEAAEQSPISVNIPTRPPEGPASASSTAPGPISPTSATAAEASVPKPAEPSSSTSPPVQAPKAAPTQPKPKPGGPPPPVSEKPSSFKDRIAAFNKPAAAPVTPFKPSGLGSGSSGFIKKPFVAPPPSKNSYVAPRRDAPVSKVYRRDEDPEIREREAENLENAERAGLMPTKSNEAGEGDEDEPKPLSLKERLALLQKQQAEQASRHADAAAKKEKPKRPPKKRTDTDVTEGGEQAAPAPPLQRRDTEDTTGRSSIDESHPPRVTHPKRRASSKDVEARDGNEADLSGAGDTTEGPEDLTEREDSDEKSKRVATASFQDNEDLDEEEEVDEEDEEDVDPEVRRKEELRARMARLGGGMGMPGLFGAPMMPMPGSSAPPKKKKSTAGRRSEDAGEVASPGSSAPPVPTPIALPGMSRVRSPEEEHTPEMDDDSDDDQPTPLKTPHQEDVPSFPARGPGEAPPVPGSRPAPPPVPSDSRPTPSLPTSATDVKSPSEGSESDDELSERTPQESDAPPMEPAKANRAPPPPPVAVPPQMPPTSPRSATSKRRSLAEELSPTSPARPAASKRDSRPPPPIPGAAPGLPAQTRPPPPPPPSAAPPLNRTTTGNSRAGGHEEIEEEVTEYEGDYDTDIASSVPHKDALKSHQRESSLDDTMMSAGSPGTDGPSSQPPPIPSSAQRAPPPIPSQAPPPPAPNSRKSADFPRTAPPPPPPPPAKGGAQFDDDEYDPFNYTGSPQVELGLPEFPQQPPPPQSGRPSQDPYSPESPFASPGMSRGPPPAPPANRGPGRQSLDVQRPSQARRSMDASRPSTESGFVANDIDLANQSGWWLQPKSLPPQLQGRKDLFSESEESTAANPRRSGRMTVTRDIYVLYQDYSQTVITVRFDPQDSSDVQLEQRHEAPPRVPRQDQLEQSYERFGRAIGEAAQGKKDTVVGDGSPQGFIYELLRPFNDALLPVGTRAYGALIYGNMANASVTQTDEIRPGDIVSIRNAKFQGKHGAMHAKYSMEVGKPDHVAVVAEWDGTKKKVRAWEQGRENKKVKMESYKLDDLRSGEVKIWRVMPRAWIGWEGVN